MAYKSIIKKMIPGSLLQTRTAINSLCRIHRDSRKWQVYKKCKILTYNGSANREDDYVRQMTLAFNKVNIRQGEYYLYPYDANIYRVIPNDYKLICSITVDFQKVISSSLEVLKNNFICCEDKNFANRHLEMIKAIEKLADRIRTNLHGSKNERDISLMEMFPDMLYRSPRSFDEAIQKILFYDALFWQANHWHIGLGRLDLILNEYYEKDKAAGIIDYVEAKKKLLQMVLTLNRDMLTKSKTLLGDTGQYILLGGVYKDGNNVSNDVTKIFLEIFKDYRKPDPKLILRVNKDTPLEIWNLAVESICAGSGSPLIMNENPIINNMLKFGYKKEDVSQLGTSACWEPLIIGKSFDQNNTFAPIMAYEPLNDIIKEGNDFSCFSDLLVSYKERLAEHIRGVIKDIDYDCSPLFTLFFDDCIKNQKDFTLGGAKYAFHGAQVLSLPNTINALMNIKEKVFDSNQISLEQCKNAILSDFRSEPYVKKLLLSGNNKFGACNDEVIRLTNDLMEYIGIVIKGLMMNGQPVKVGFSSPNYIMSCANTEATLDGRNANAPFAVHISPISSNIGIAEVLDFATKLNYNDNRINGNIVDFTVPHAFLKNKDRLKDLLIDSCSRGIFELQLNVLDYKKMVEAKAHPEKYPDLIVRVWGFSAFFNDLPEQYKDNLIERAKIYESS